MVHDLDLECFIFMSYKIGLKFDMVMILSFSGVKLYLINFIQCNAKFHPFIVKAMWSFYCSLLSKISLGTYVLFLPLTVFPFITSSTISCPLWWKRHISVLILFTLRAGFFQPFCYCFLTLLHIFY